VLSDFASVQSLGPGVFAVTGLAREFHRESQKKQALPEQRSQTQPHR